MDLREQRGMELAATRTISQKAGIWFVPSQAGKGTYRVHSMPKIASCTRPDHETRGVDCMAVSTFRYESRQEPRTALRLRNSRDCPNSGSLRLPEDPGAADSRGLERREEAGVSAVLEGRPDASSQATTKAPSLAASPRAAQGEGYT